MKLITWNCRNNFSKKANEVLQYQPDILIVPECECPELQTGDEVKRSNNHYWFGDNRRKGIGIFSFNGYTLQPLAIHNPAFKYIVPLRVVKGDEHYLLFAV